MRNLRLVLAGLIGTSGSGKSTLLRCANLLETIDGSAISLYGQSLLDPRIDPDLVRRHIAMVFQSFNLFPHLSVLDNVLLGPSTRGDERERRFAKRRWTCSTGSGCATGPASSPTACRAASSSARPSCVHWPSSPRCCSTR